jgi:hypothetical protein
MSIKLLHENKAKNDKYSFFCFQGVAKNPFFLYPVHVILSHITQHKLSPSQAPAWDGTNMKLGFKNTYIGSGASDYPFPSRSLGRRCKLCSYVTL